MRNHQTVVEYGIVTAHIIAGLSFLVLAITAGLLYSLQFIHTYPLSGVEFFSPGRVRMLHTNVGLYGWILNGLQGKKGLL